MKYKNKKTNVIIDIKSTLHGGDWVPLEENKKNKQSPKKSR